MLGNQHAPADAWKKREERRASAIARPRALIEELDFRHNGWWRRRQLILTGMRAAGFTSTAIDRFENCGADAWVMEHPDTGELRLRASLCHSKWCLPCARAYSLQIADNVRARITGRNFRHVVLTKVHRQAPLADQIDEIYKNFASLRKQHWWARRVLGGCAFLQAHVSPADGLWHVHIHAIVEGDYLEQWQLSIAWLIASGDSSNVHVSAVRDREKAAREVSRYVASPLDKGSVRDPDALAEMMRATHGRHLCLTWGTWWGKKLTERATADESVEWINRGQLRHFLSAAASGNEHAAEVLRVLTRSLVSETGPPHLFYQPSA